MEQAQADAGRQEGPACDTVEVEADSAVAGAADGSRPGEVDPVRLGHALRPESNLESPVLDRSLAGLEAGLDRAPTGAPDRAVDAMDDFDIAQPGPAQGTTRDRERDRPGGDLHRLIDRDRMIGRLGHCHCSFAARTDRDDSQRPNAGGGTHRAGPRMIAGPAGRRSSALDRARDPARAVLERAGIMVDRSPTG